MELEKQVVSLELSKRLKELKCRQESLWWWVKPDLKGNLKFRIAGKDCLTWSGATIYSAFTVAELGEMLPIYIDNAEILWMSFKKEDEQHKWYCIDYGFDHNDYEQGANTEADARASMLCHLKENKLI